MDDIYKQPVVLVFAGPNGSGKTTATKALPVIGTYVNADDLKMKFGLSDLEAAQQAEALRNELLNSGADFTFETVMSTERNLLLLQKAKSQGYEVLCVYVLTCDENINVARVKSRFAAGGHDVPEDKIRARYHRALALLPQLIPICDKMLIYDNSNDISSKPSLIFKKWYEQTEIYPDKYWSKEKLQKLLGI